MYYERIITAEYKTKFQYTLRRFYNNNYDENINKITEILKNYESIIFNTSKIISTAKSMLLNIQEKSKSTELNDEYKVKILEYLSTIISLFINDISENQEEADENKLSNIGFMTAYLKLSDDTSEFIARLAIPLKGSSKKSPSQYID